MDTEGVSRDRPEISGRVNGSHVKRVGGASQRRDPHRGDAAWPVGGQGCKRWIGEAVQEPGHIGIAVGVDSEHPDVPDATADLARWVRLSRTADKSMTKNDRLTSAGAVPRPTVAGPAPFQVEASGDP
ncbi:hypothetical protein [Actinocrispum wychmicini]|uniref:hypothetical protein n=1 Tax=Actinocrispum wychmicini TaxID=1213861 RepID=UPI00104F1247|nr:hypothetical protein [Actinocrispum wychmicini]